MDTATAQQDDIRHDWSRGDALDLFELPFNDLLFRAQQVHRGNFHPNRVQISSLLSIKTGGCPEDCKYCPQSAHHEDSIASTKLMDLGSVCAAAREARSAGATRFCMGAAWRKPHDRDIEAVATMVSEVKSLGLETCMTLGMLTQDQARRLKAAGLDYYNHNIDTSESYYGEIITTRQYADRLETLTHVRDADINVCCGGIVGMGEGREDRADMMVTLATLPRHPESVPINMLVRAEGIPLVDVEPFDQIEFVRTVAVARIMMPRSVVRLSAGRMEMDDSTQALCFLAGANSIFHGDTLLTTDNPAVDKDRALFERLGLSPMG